MPDFGKLCPADRATAIVDDTPLEASDSFAVDRLRISLLYEKDVAAEFSVGADCELVLDAVAVEVTITGVTPASETSDYAVVTFEL